MTLLLTGATGFVGTELLARFLRDPGARIVALVRADDDAHATRRLHATLLGAFGAVQPYAARVRAVAGDLERPGLGIDPALAEDIDEIVHGAASVSFELELERSRAINVEGTRRVLAFAAGCPRLRRLTYVSTAYVAGAHRGVFHEDDYDVGQRFRNPYEQSKFEAEGLVRAAGAAGLPVTIARPSIVVGDRHSGWTASFNVLYWPLRALAKGAYPILPARRSAPVDVVSVDYVADAICALHAMPRAAGGTFHLTAGDGASSIGELLDLAVARLECRRPPLVSPLLYRRLLHPLALRLSPRRRRRFLRATQTYLPYFAMRVRYDNACWRAGALDRSAGPERWTRFRGGGTAVLRLGAERIAGGPAELSRIPKLDAVARVVSGAGGRGMLGARVAVRSERLDDVQPFVLCEHARCAAGAGVHVHATGPLQQFGGIDRGTQIVSVRHGAVAAHQRSLAPLERLDDAVGEVVGPEGRVARDADVAAERQQRVMDARQLVADAGDGGRHRRMRVHDRPGVGVCVDGEVQGKLGCRLERPVEERPGSVDDGDLMRRQGCQPSTGRRDGDQIAAAGALTLPAVPITRPVVASMRQASTISARSWSILMLIVSSTVPRRCCADPFIAR